MRIATYTHSGTMSYGFVHDGVVVPRDAVGVEANDVASLIAGGQLPDTASVAAATGVPLADVTLMPPLQARKILCAGVNFGPHREEGGLPPERSEYPVLFTRFADSVVGDQQPLRKPAFTDVFDYEGELAVIIGKRAWQVPVEEALDYVFGYSCFNDGTVRDWQRHSPQWIPGKNFWQSGAFGPWIVTTDEVADIDGSRLQTRVNGEVRQEALIRDMLFSTAELIAYISQFTPLEPGDVIAAGTPGGVGMFMDPLGVLSDGDLVEVEIDGIGTLTNRVSEA